MRDQTTDCARAIRQPPHDVNDKTYQPNIDRSRADLPADCVLTQKSRAKHSSSRLHYVDRYRECEGSTERDQQLSTSVPHNEKQTTTTTMKIMFLFQIRNDRTMHRAKKFSSAGSSSDIIMRKTYEHMPTTHTNEPPVDKTTQKIPITTLQNAKRRHSRLYGDRRVLAQQRCQVRSRLGYANREPTRQFDTNRYRVS